MSGRELLSQMAARVQSAQAEQPSLGAEARAAFRQGREDFLATLMGPLAGQTREPGAPGTPTPQQVTEGLEHREVDSRQDRLKQPEIEMDR